MIQSLCYPFDSLASTVQSGPDGFYFIVQQTSKVGQQKVLAIKVTDQALVTQLSKFGL